MKLTSKRLLFAPIILASVLWQPSHHFMMHNGMAMNSGTHILITAIPFLSVLLALSKSKWNW